ncbi:unnamed protein product [Ilex paraguariensis]|uniref:Uncharacterized protein n=1 Tax=Ilex paraguariensis TaxID=185542 RepID=A0ABC8UX99_9AQUA
MGTVVVPSSAGIFPENHENGAIGRPPKELDAGALFVLKSRGEALRGFFLGHRFSVVEDHVLLPNLHRFGNGFLCRTAERISALLFMMSLFFLCLDIDVKVVKEIAGVDGRVMAALWVSSYDGNSGAGSSKPTLCFHLVGLGGRSHLPHRGGAGDVLLV